MTTPTATPTDARWTELTERGARLGSSRRVEVLPDEVYAAAADAYDEALNAELRNPPGRVMGEAGQRELAASPAFRAAVAAAVMATARAAFGTLAPSTTEAELREQLAAIEHERWADWQRWMHGQGRRDERTRALVIPAIVVDGWEEQIATAYSDLSDQEKALDREQVDRYWPIVQAAFVRLRAELADAKHELATALYTAENETTRLRTVVEILTADQPDGEEEDAAIGALTQAWPKWFVDDRVFTEQVVRTALLAAWDVNHDRRIEARRRAEDLAHRLADAERNVTRFKTRLVDDTARLRERLAAVRTERDELAQALDRERSLVQQTANERTAAAVELARLRGVIGRIAGHADEAAAELAHVPEFGKVFRATAIALRAAIATSVAQS